MGRSSSFTPFFFAAAQVSPIRAATRPPRRAPGKTSAKAVVMEFSEFHCPFCRQVQPVLVQLLAISFFTMAAFVMMESTIGIYLNFRFGYEERQVGYFFGFLGIVIIIVQGRLIGPLTGTWAEGLHQVRGPQSLRVMQGLLQLAEKFPAPELEKATGIALHHGAWHLRDLKRLLTLPGNVVQMDFLQTHPLIRSLEAYRIEPPQTHPPQNS